MVGSDGSVVEPVVVAVDLDLEELFDRRTLGALLEMVAFKLGHEGFSGEAWIETVLANLKDVGVDTVRGFVESVLVVNRRLADGGHPPLYELTIQAMLEEACDMVFVPGSQV
jgi:hypothetical protein